MEKNIIIKNKISLHQDYIHQLRQAYLEDYADAYEKMIQFCEKIKENGGKAYLVGGAVRDMLFGTVAKDFDLEIYNLDNNKIKEIASEFGKVSEVGKSFGVLKLTFPTGVDIDISLPRKESKTGPGHKGFEVEFDPNLSIKDSARRRDFTINSMLADPLTGEIEDPFGGLEDLEFRILRIVDKDTFKEDPLRVLRALQFISRFDLGLDPESEKIIKEMIPFLKELPAERIFEEWKKLLLKSEHPSWGLFVGMESGILSELHPELTDLVKTPQDLEWHPEGNVWQHTLVSLDEAAKIIRREKLSEKDALPIMLAVLCHDLGKPVTTEFLEGRIRSRGHEEAGAGPTKSFLRSLRCDNETQDKVIKLVMNHLAPTHLYNAEKIKEQKVGDGAIRRLARRIAPANILELVYVSEADQMGSGLPPSADKEILKKHEAGEWLLERAREIEVERKGPENLIEGKDLIELGFEPGPEFGVVIDLANELRDEKGFSKEDFFELAKEKSIDEIIKSLEKY